LTHALDALGELGWGEPSFEMIEDPGVALVSSGIM
jgi:hypothetical protein